MGAGPQRNFGLDVLRCLAIVMVLANHAFLGFFVEVGHVAWTGPRAFLSILSFISIEWLFVLSGFLIGAMMIRSFEKESTWWGGARSFWLRRWFRTLPNYYLFLLVNILIVASGIVAPRFTGTYSVLHPFFVQNLAWAERVPMFFNEAWSLALDEWFYVTLPILVGIGSRILGAKVRTAFVLATATLIAVPTVLRLLAPLPATPFDWDLGIRRVTIYHLDATGWGVLAAMASRWRPSFWTRNVAGRALVGGLLMVAGILAIEEMFFQHLTGGLGWRVFTAWPRFPVAFGLTLTGAGTFLAFPWIAAIPAPSGRWRSGIEAVSNYTYSLYLSHFPLLYILVGVLGSGEVPVPRATLWAQLAFWAILVLGVSALVYHKFEKPISDLRDRFTRKVDASPFQATP